MVHFLYLTLQVFLLCLFTMRALSDTNILIFEVEAQNPVEATETTYNVMVNFSKILHVADASYLSVALGSTRAANNYGSVKLQNLAAALSPCEIRLGGTNADFLVFDPDGSSVCHKDHQNQDSIWDKLDSGYFNSPKVTENYTFTMTGQQWDSFNKFITLAGWDLLFDVNLFFWRSDGYWDSTNAELLLNYSAARGVRIPYFQLGNEPNAFWGNFQFRIDPAMLLEDYKILKNLTSKYPLYASSKFCGPDVANVAARGSSRDYLQGFVTAGAYDVLDEYSLHHYYLNADTATSADFLSVVTLDSLKQMLEQTLLIAKASPRPLPFRQTETSSCYGGGATGLSDRYIAGFLWLDKLGLSAQYGTTRVFRQSFLGAAYALVTNSITPTPDYYLSVLFKKLIEGPVFNISAAPLTPNLRLYAHCARRGVYVPGALTIYYLNVGSSDTVLSLAQFQDADLDLYLLTPGDANGITSSFVKLNGITLLMPGNTLPPLPPKPYKGTVTVAAQSFGFIVIPHANVTQCVEYYANVDSKLNNDEDNTEKWK